MRAKQPLEPRHSAIYLGRRFFQVAHAAAAEAHADIGLSSCTSPPASTKTRWPIG
jgi:hypothetical protein